MKTQLLASAALLGLAASAQATPVFTDNFTSGTAAAAGYYRFGTTNTTLVADGGNIDFSYATGASTRSGFYKTFTNQTLAVGDTLTFSFTVDGRTLANNESHAFRWSIGNASSATVGVGETMGSTNLASATPLTSGTRQMYQFSASTGTTTGFGQYVTGSTSPTHNQSGTATAIAGFTGPASVATTGASTVSVSFLRTETGYSISQTAFGTSSSGTLATFTDSFNTIAFSFNNVNAYAISLDNISVSVTSPIPEPASFAALAGLGALGFVASRRRRA